MKHLHQAIPQYSIKNAPDESCTVLEEVEWKMAVIVGSISAALKDLDAAKQFVHFLSIFTGLLIHEHTPGSANLEILIK